MRVSAPASGRGTSYGFALIVGAFCAYAIIYIARVSFVVDGVRYFTLADDQMISMRYAENVARGHGLVWNPGGERIEGYTNFLWVLYMAVFHWLGVPRPLISACIQVSGALFLVLNLVAVRAIATRLFGSGPALLATALVAFYIPLDNWAFQGTEVSVLTLMVTCGTWWTLQAFDRDATPWPLFLLLGATTLVRPDMVVFCAVVLLALAVGSTKAFARHRPERATFRRAIAGAGIVAAFLSVETAFRLWYFGDPLPNTYYLKVTGSDVLPKWSRGLLVTALFVAQTVPLAAPMFVGGWLRRAPRDVKLLLAVFLAQVLYSVLVGGDTWELWGGSNRFIAIAMPLFLICSAAALVDLWSGLAAAVRRRFNASEGVPARWAATAAAAVLIVSVNMMALSLANGVMVGAQRLFLVVKPYETTSDEGMVRAALALRAATTDDAVVGVVWAGAIPYFSERPAIDLLGKMDRRIAHAPMRPPDPAYRWFAFHPGHMKWDYAYSVGELKPDVIQAPLWLPKTWPTEPTPYLDRDYDLRTIGGAWYVRKGTSRVR